MTISALTQQCFLPYQKNKCVGCASAEIWAFKIKQIVRSRICGISYDIPYMIYQSFKNYIFKFSRIFENFQELFSIFFLKIYYEKITMKNYSFFKFWYTVYHIPYFSKILKRKIIYSHKVRIEMFPSKRKYKTKVQHVDSPRFNECFKVPRVNSDDVEKMGCRIR